MTKAKVRLACAGLAALSASSVQAGSSPGSLSITPYDPATSLAALTSALLAANSGITVTGSSFVGISGQAGTYTGFNLPSSTGGPTITAPNGIMMTNGTVSVPFSNTSPNFSTTTNTGGNAMLSALSASQGGTTVTYDQNVLNLTFTVNNTSNNAIKASFIYGSEEYPYQSVTDIFGFFVDGKNYAFFPDGSLVSFKPSTASNFNSNESDSYALEYNGITNLLTINGLLDPSLSTHTLTIAIADTSDSIYDSAAFLSGLQASLVSGPGGITPGSGTIDTTNGDIAPNIFSLGSSAAQQSTVVFDGGTLRMIGGSFASNVIAAPVTIEASNGTVDTSTGNGGFSGPVSGPGSLTIIGGGTFTLTGNNSYVGGTIVNASTVAVGSATALGTGALALNAGTLQAVVDGLTLANAVTVNGASAVDTQAFTLTLTGPIGGTGSLAKSGTSGTLVLAGGSTYSGATVVEAGTLRAGASSAFSPSSAVLVADGATLDLAGFSNTVASLAGAGTVTNSGATAAHLTLGQTGVTTFSGSLSDGGAPLVLTKQGSGTLNLTGASSFSGGTFLDDGSLVVGNGTALGTGALTMAPGTTLGFSNSLTLPNPIAFAAAGDPTIDTGANDVTLSGVISGPGNLTKLGTGTLDLTAVNTYTGSTSVAQGVLLVDGSIANSVVTVLSGAALGGSGTIGGLALQSGATLVPGARTPFSTLTILGNASFASGSTYAITVDAAGQGDRLVVGGTAALNGATLSINTLGGLIGPSTHFDILRAAGGITGQFGQVLSTSSAFLAPQLTYGGSDVSLGFVQTAPFTSVATTPNQFGAAGALQSLGLGNPLYDAILNLDPASARQAFQQLSGETHASATTSGLIAGRVTSSIIFDRLWNLPIPQAGDALDALKQFEPHNVPTLLNCYAPVTAPATGVRPAQGYTVWGQAIGDFGHSGSDGNAAPVDRTLGGFMLGLDTRVDARGFETWRVGVAGGYTNTSFDVKEGGGAGTFENVFGSVYAGARYGAMTLRLGGTVGGTQTNLQRTVAFPGFFEAERSNNGGDTGQVFGEVGYRFSSSIAVVEPILNGAYTHTHQDGYREKGGVAALVGAPQDVDVESTTLGVRGEVLPVKTLPIVARLFLGWLHTYGDVNPAASVAFASGGLAFSSYGTPLDRNAVVAEAGLDYRATAALSLGLTYFGQAGERSIDNAVKGRVEYRF